MAKKRDQGAREAAAKDAYCYSNILFEMPFFAIIMIVIHLEFFEYWFGQVRGS